MRLTREQRAAFFAGDWPKLKGEGSPPVEVGHVCRLSSRLAFEVTRIRRTRKGEWSLEYTVLDRRADRDLYLLPTARSLETDEKGRVLPMPAEEEHGYTGNPKRRTLDAGRVPLSYQNVLSMQARDRDAKRAVQADQAAQTYRSDAERAGRQLRDVCTRMGRLGLDPTPMLAELQRQLAEQEERMREDEAA